MLALDTQLRELGLPVRKFGETHLDRLKRWNCEKQRRAAAPGGEAGASSAANPKREGWMTMAARDEESGAAEGAADDVGGEEEGESAKAAALMGSLDSLLMGTSSLSAKQQKRESDKGGDILRNEDQPAFLKKMADAQAAGTVPGAPGLWVPQDLAPSSYPLSPSSSPFPAPPDYVSAWSRPLLLPSLSPPPPP